MADDTTEYWAANMIFDKVSYDDVDLGYGKNAGVFTAGDAKALALEFGMDPTWFTDAPGSFVDDDGTFVAPWPVALELAMRLAPSAAEEVLKQVSADEEKARKRAIYGDYLQWSRTESVYLTAEACAETDARWQPSHNLLRAWCGADAVARRFEIEDLRAEVLHIGQSAERAIRELDALGARRSARKLEKELHVPIDVLRVSQRVGQSVGRRNRVHRSQGPRRASIVRRSGKWSVGLASNQHQGREILASWLRVRVALS